MPSQHTTEVTNMSQVTSRRALPAERADTYTLIRAEQFEKERRSRKSRTILIQALLQQVQA